MGPGGNGGSGFDPEDVRQRLGQDPELLAELVLSYQEELPVMVERLRECLNGLEHGRFDHLAETAHWIKGGLAMLSSPGAFSAAGELEQAARARDSAACVRAGDLLPGFLEQLSKELADLL